MLHKYYPATYIIKEQYSRIDIDIDDIDESLKDKKRKEDQ